MTYLDIFRHIASLGILRFNQFVNQTINETIKVAGVFDYAYFKPVWFEWQRKKYKINRVTLVSDFKQGMVKKRVYSVLVQDSLYRLDFDLTSHRWLLSEICLDG